MCVCVGGGGKLISGSSKNILVQVCVCSVKVIGQVFSVFYVIILAYLN